MATVKCPLGKRGESTHEWNDGAKDRVYCMGWVDRRTDDPLPECLVCQDHVSHAQDDLDSFHFEKYYDPFSGKPYPEYQSRWDDL